MLPAKTKTAGWLYHFLFATLATFVAIACVFAFAKSISQLPVWTVLIIAVLSVLKYVILTCSVLRKDIVIIDDKQLNSKTVQEDTPCTPADFH